MRQNEREAVEEFLMLTKPLLPRKVWNTHHSLWGHGEYEFAFHWTLEHLTTKKLTISNNLRKSIERCLSALNSTRSDYSELAKLDYGEYWNKEYG